MKIISFKLANEILQNIDLKIALKVRHLAFVEIEWKLK